MSSFPALSALRAACFPGGLDDGDNSDLLNSVSELVLKRVFTRPRSSATTHRHPTNQAGMVLEEDGNTVIRAGHELYDHSVGSTIVLRPDGTIVVTAPAGILLSGPLLTSDNPTDALNMGGLQLDPKWENTHIVTVLNPLLLDTFFVAPAPGVPAVIPLSTVFQTALLYQSPENLLNV